jgi:hypothetical protein
MTLAEIKTFLTAATKKSAQKQIQFIIATAVGAQGDKKGIDKTIKQLTDSIEAITNEQPII